MGETDETEGIQSKRKEVEIGELESEGEEIVSRVISGGGGAGCARIDRKYRRDKGARHKGGNRERQRAESRTGTASTYSRDCLDSD